MKTNRLLKITLTSFCLAFGLSTIISCKDDEACTTSVWYADTDSDGLGDPDVSIDSCDQPEGYVDNNEDTDDTIAFCEVSTWYEDIDGDGLGNAEVSTEACEQPEGYVDNSDDTFDIPNAQYTVSAALQDTSEGYFVTTDDLLTEPISIVGNGYEGYANLSVSLDGYFYDWNDVEQTVDKYEFTDTGLVKQDAVSYGALFPSVTFRHVHSTGTGYLLLSSNPAAGEIPYLIINLESFTIESFGNLVIPEYDGYAIRWVQPIVQGDKVYFGANYGVYGEPGIPNELVTVKYDFPAMTNPEIITSDKSAGSVAGHRSNAFKTEEGIVYQHNITSRYWYGWDAENDELADASSVFVRIVDGEYDDDYVLDVSANYDEKVVIWNAWYGENNIAYANIVKESDVTVWGDLRTNISTLVEVNLETGAVTELNIPQGPYVEVFKAECVNNGKFYFPVSISGGDANIYEITIGGGANGFQKGAVLDGSNVFVNAIYNNF